MRPVRWCQLTAVIAAVVTLSCGGSTVDGRTWLVVTGGDTVTVAEAGLAWDSLGEAEREMFTSRDNPVGEFVLALARKRMVFRELEEGGWLTAPDVTGQRRWWLMAEGAAAARQHMRESEARAVSEDDIERFREMMGSVVWYTVSPGPGSQAAGPAHLPELETALSLTLDTLETGETGVTADGRTLRLDSLVETEPELVEQTLADTGYVRELAVQRLSQGRVRRWVLETTDSLMALPSVRIDTTALHSLADYEAGEAEMPDTSVIAVSTPRGDFSLGDLMDMTDFHEGRMPVQPSDPAWLLFMSENVILQCRWLEYLEEWAPEVADSLAAAADRWLVEHATDALYEASVSENVTVTEEALEEQMSRLEQPVMMPERRVLEIALIPPELMEDYRAAVVDSALDRLLPELSGLPWMQGPDPERPRVTPPLMRGQVPGGYGDLVFDLPVSDTVSWSGPHPLSESEGSILIRLVEALPERPATLEEAAPVLEEAVRARLEEQATVQWMTELEGEYGLEVNEGALDDLPSDPSLWSAL